MTGISADLCGVYRIRGTLTLTRSGCFFANPGCLGAMGRAGGTLRRHSGVADRRNLLAKTPLLVGQ